MKQKTIKHPEEWWDAFAAAAAEEGLSLAEWSGNCMLVHLPKAVRDKLPPRKAPPSPTNTSEIQLSIPVDHEAAWKAQAAAEGVSLTDWILQCCLANLPGKVRDRLTERATAAPSGIKKRNKFDSNATNRIRIACPDDWKAAIQTAATAAEKTVTAWVRWSCSASLPAAVRSTLTEPQRGRRKKES